MRGPIVTHSDVNLHGAEVVPLDVGYVFVCGPLHCIFAGIAGS